LPVMVKVLVAALAVRFKLLAVKFVLRMDRFPLTVTFIDVSVPLVTIKPVDLPPPNITLTLPIPGTVRLLLPVMVNAFVDALAVIFRPVVIKVEPATVRLLLTVILTLVTEPSVTIRPFEFPPPRITLRLPIFGTESEALPFTVNVLSAELAVRLSLSAVKLVLRMERLPLKVELKLLNSPLAMTIPGLDEFPSVRLRLLTP